MTKQEAQDLVARILKEAGEKVQAKIGQCNGSAVVHLIREVPRNDGQDGTTRTSVNITAPAEWDLHEARRANRPRKSAKKIQQEGEAMLADEATIDQALHTVYEP